MKEENISITAKDGYILGATLRAPESDSKGVVQINSGTGIPQEFYRHFAKHLTELGYITITYDYRGIGKSKPKSLKGFEATNLQWGTLDMSAVLDWSIATYPNLKKIAVGHSMGGQLIGFMENNDKIDKVVLIASGTGYWKEMPEGMMKWLMPLLWYVYMPFNTFVFGFANAKKIRQGENLPKGVAQQWRKWCLNKDYWDSDFDMNNNPFAKITAPIKSLMFQDDNIISKVSNEKLLQYYAHTSIDNTEISPEVFGIKKLGHFGYFSKKSEKLWASLI